MEHGQQGDVGPETVSGEDPVADTAARPAEGSDAEPAAHAQHGYVGNKQDYLRRLRRIEGQTRGLQRMITDDEYCIDILTQISATTRALQSVAVALLDEHLHHCVATAVTEGGRTAQEKLDEASAAISRLVRS